MHTQHADAEWSLTGDLQTDGHCTLHICSFSAGQEPQFYKDKYGVRYLKTDKGSPVAVAADKRGNIIMLDRAGNQYYDAGSPQLGVYMVSEGLF